jgi:ribosomal protein S27AE
MVRWRLKSCPRCGSDMFIDKDFDNWYEQCLMCSYRVDLQRINGLEQPVPVDCADEEGGTLKTDS